MVTMDGQLRVACPRCSTGQREPEPRLLAPRHETQLFYLWWVAVLTRAPLLLARALPSFERVRSARSCIAYTEPVHRRVRVERSWVGLLMT